MNPGLLLAVMTLAAYRLWRLAAIDDLPPVAAVRDRLQARVEWRYGDRWADGLTCPWCSGTWVAFAVVAAVDLYGMPVALPVLQALAVATGVGLIARAEL